MRHEIFDSVTAVFFDLDNTLISRDASFKEILPTWLKSNVPELHEAEYGSHVVQIMLNDRSGFCDRDEFALWIQRKYKLEALSRQQIISDFASAIAANIKRNFEVIEFVFSLRKRYALGIISNGSGRTQRQKLNKAGLQKSFDADKIYIEGETGIAKPDPAMFLLPFQQHRIFPEDTLFIGDHPIDDIGGASRAGMKTCWIKGQQDTSDLAVSPDVIVASIDDLFQEK